ncbi:Hypothetical protein R9X50_00492700 [Acrodontium crateriforme]|uniref:Knr4/Smi1-like domain-containing protein n=1 Tax=Acrodontium crateriforme TaxID=150365 RepID=A0AAQ3MBU6_9PEZI|nr:Hypothetical protein R9X50_00492700 [Acrodontium crateriforme]
MAGSSLASQWRAFWHTMTSNDRHASHDSPYRTGSHVPLQNNRHSPLTSVVHSAEGSRVDLSSSYSQEGEAANGFISSNAPGSPGSPYSPGMRTTLQRQASGLDSRMESVATGEIQMQSFSDGLPPPPPVSHSWKRMDRWLEDNYEELFENLGQPATINDVNELEHELDCTLPQDVRESLQVHDGQERGGLPSGAIFGCMLLDCEEIVQEWQNWRTVNEAYLNDGQKTYEIPQAPTKAFAGSSSSAVPVAQANSASSTWREDLLSKQDCHPPNTIQKAYAHPAWIPLARDWGGNNIAVDLAPGPTGKWGQIILMGRDYDCKYVISRSWSAFLATVADDMNTDKWFIDEDSKELKFRQFKQQGVEPAYIDILRWRTEQKYGRKRQSKRPLKINSNVPGGSTNGFSPYTSPTSAVSEDGRGRSPHRFPHQKAPATSSPRGLISSPLARVTEETPQPLKLDPEASDAMKSTEKLITLDTPKANSSAKFDPIDTPVSASDSKISKSKLSLESSPDAGAEAIAIVKEESTIKSALAGAEDEMKEVTI